MNGCSRLNQEADVACSLAVGAIVSGMLPQTSARSSAAMRKNLLNASALRRIVHEIVEKHLEDRAREAGKEQRGNQPHPPDRTT